MKCALLFVLLAAAPVCAQGTAPAPAPATAPEPVAVTTPTAQVVAPSSTTDFLSSRGVLSNEELVEALNTRLTPQQRGELDQALAKRNAALNKANNELSATLRELLRVTDEGLTQRIDEGAEARRMERMRRLQPGRYEQLMGRKKKEQEKAEKKRQEQQPTP